MTFRDILKKLLKPSLIRIRNFHTTCRIRQRLSSGKPLKLVIGASGVFQKEWIPVEQYFLDITKKNDWERAFVPGQIDIILTEHVWEHLMPEDALVAVAYCYEFLKTGGYIRIAVPDGNHPDPEYRRSVMPGGTGQGAEDHKVLYTGQQLQEIFSAAGFRVDLLEYFDAEGVFHERDWSPDDGMVYRSRRFDERNQDGQLHYTSIILDAVKTETRNK